MFLRSWFWGSFWWSLIWQLSLQDSWLLLVNSLFEHLLELKSWALHDSKLCDSPWNVYINMISCANGNIVWRLQRASATGTATPPCWLWVQGKVIMAKRRIIEDKICAFLAQTTNDVFCHLSASLSVLVIADVFVKMRPFEAFETNLSLKRTQSTATIRRFWHDMHWQDLIRPSRFACWLLGPVEIPRVSERPWLKSPCASGSWFSSLIWEYCLRKKQEMAADVILQKNEKHLAGIDAWHLKKSSCLTKFVRRSATAGSTNMSRFQVAFASFSPRLKADWNDAAVSQAWKQTVNQPRASHVEKNTCHRDTSVNLACSSGFFKSRNWCKRWKQFGLLVSRLSYRSVLANMIGFNEKWN